MHVGDALVSPAVAAVAGGISVLLLAIGAGKIKKRGFENMVPLMGVMGAFIFACQMINFTIPGTGSSGHIVGGILLASVLGAWGGFITLASVLVIQALFFADGGLLAVGCNILNMGVCTCLIAFPVFFKPIIHGWLNFKRVLCASILSCVIGLELGAFLVTAETELSGITALPTEKFLLFMLPIHLAIGICEGLATAAVIWFIYKYKPELLAPSIGATTRGIRSNRKAVIALVAVTLLTGGVISWFASSKPDGLEWSLYKTAGTETPEGRSDDAHRLAERIQDKTAFMPDYTLKKQPAEPAADQQFSENATTSLAGITGAVVILLLFLGTGLFLKKRRTATHKK